MARTRGEGSTWRNPRTGRYHAQRTLGWHVTPEGQRRRQVLTRTGRTAAEARANLTRALRDREQAAHAAAHLTVDAFLDKYLADAVAPYRAPGTLRLYAGTLRRYVRPRLGATLLRAVTPADVHGCCAAVQRLGRPATAKFVHTLIRAALNVAVEWELLERNPASRVRLPTPPPQRPRQSLTVAQARRLFRALEAEPEGARWLVALVGGLRSGELRGLCWDQLDWATGALLVDRQVQWQGGQPVLSPIKTRRPYVVDLPPVVLAALRRWRESAPAPVGGPWADLVFPTAQGRPWQQKPWQQAWRRLCARLGLPLLTVHDLRRSSATIGRLAGIPVEVAVQRLGHSSPGQLLQVYSAVGPDQRQAAVKAWEALLTEGDAELTTNGGAKSAPAIPE